MADQLTTRLTHEPNQEVQQNAGPGPDAPQQPKATPPGNLKPTPDQVQARVKKLQAKWPAFQGKDKLPRDQKLAALKNKEHKVVGQKCVGRGTMHYSLRTCRDGYELIGHYRNGRGIATCLVKRLKTSYKAAGARRSQDSALLKELGIAGLPVTHN